MLEKREVVCAVILAAGKGKRMNSDIPKQYMDVCGKPILYYTLKAFQDCPEVDSIILVTGEGEQERCREEYVEGYRFEKIENIIAGGRERFDSVYRGLEEVGKFYGSRMTSDRIYVMIHDGARPLTDNQIIHNNLRKAREKGSAVTGMPVKDTIRICSPDGTSINTPDRRTIWQVQTPQTFRFSLIFQAYQKMMDSGEVDGITDDGMVMERFGGSSVSMVEGSYRNIKITSPEDLDWMRNYLLNR